jgi:hypothetical protein
MRPKADLVFDKFEFRFALIPAVHKPAIKALADRIVALAQQMPGPLGTIRLVGHTDFIGDEKYNKSLGMNRAKAVRVALAGELNIKMRGVTPRLEIVPESRGELQPVTTDTSDAARELNRRVEVFVSLNSPVSPPTTPKVPRVPKPGDITTIPEPGPPYSRRPTEIEDILRKKIPKLERKCVNPHDVVVKFLRSVLDDALKGSPIPSRFHDRIRKLAENRARDMRDDLIDRGLEEMGLEGRFKVPARRLIVQAINKACF